MLDLKRLFDDLTDARQALLVVRRTRDQAQAVYDLVKDDALLTVWGNPTYTNETTRKAALAATMRVNPTTEALAEAERNAADAALRVTILEDRAKQANLEWDDRWGWALERVGAQLTDASVRVEAFGRALDAASRRLTSGPTVDLRAAPLIPPRPGSEAPTPSGEDYP